MPETYYLDSLYPLQDKVLGVIERLELDFYLTGGTALGRCYLAHRYSDDLDLFVNNNDNFKKECGIAIDALKSSWKCDVAATSETFARIFLQQDNTTLKIDFVNDVPYHYGDIERSTIFHRIDNWRNILSNKLCAISRLEAKDIADIVFIAKKFEFEWEAIVSEAREKDVWVDPIELCRIISQFPAKQLDTIKWIKDVNFQDLKENIITLQNDILMGSENSLTKIGKYSFGR